MKIYVRILLIALFLYVCYAIVTYGWVLRLTCNRNAVNQIDCIQQWTLLELIPLGKTQAFNWHDLKRVCYKDGCNYGIDYLADGNHLTLAGTSAEPFDLFLSYGGDSLTYYLGDWSTYITWIEFTTYPILVLGGFVLLYSGFRQLIRQVYAKRNANKRG